MDRIQESLGCKPLPSARAALDNAVNVSSVKGVCFKFVKEISSAFLPSDFAIYQF